MTSEEKVRRIAYIRYVSHYLRSNSEILENKGIRNFDHLISRPIYLKKFCGDNENAITCIYRAFSKIGALEDDNIDLVYRSFRIPIEFGIFIDELRNDNSEFTRFLAMNTETPVNYTGQPKPIPEGGRLVTYEAESIKRSVPNFGSVAKPEVELLAIIENLKIRNMFKGVFAPLNLPLIECENCKKLIDISKAWTLQDNCMMDYNDKLEAYCDFGCALIHQKAIRDKHPKDYSCHSDYYLQPLFQILLLTMNQNPTED